MTSRRSSSEERPPGGNRRVDRAEDARLVTREGGEDKLRVATVKALLSI